MKRTIIAAALAIAAISSAQAAAITGLANTGTGAGGTLDSHYTLTAASSDTTIAAVVPTITYDNQWPISPWLANDGISKWITPTASQSQTFDASSAGTYTYSLSFDLSGYNAASAAFTGRLAADNSVVVKLNDQVISTASGFTDWTSFAASSGFVSGVNTLNFVVSNWAQNGGNPTGLRVEFASSQVAAAVPEPETYAMMLAGVALLGVVARRRKAA
ncbi:FxDxF family PEP-CTERM protein [Duganella sp. CT11-25]|jgi:opacity protein-like surface antigen|uniref:FxDxF family PEP-CTERM protein n=1 Tax=unclassified Duganella TaxID=2636909 RepID=UPI0039B091B0